MTGSLPAPTSDGVLVTTVNSVANKIDVFLHRDVRYEAAIDRSGLLTGTISVGLRNDAPSAGLPFYVIGSLARPPTGTGDQSHHVADLLVGAGHRGVHVDGGRQRAAQYRSAGWWVNELTVELPPGTRRTVDVTVRGRVGTEPYALELVPGGAVTPERYVVDVRHAGGGSVTFDGDLTVPLELSGRP